MFNRDEGDVPFGVGVLVSKGGLFLCGVRLDNGQVCGPGGHMHDDETPQQAAVRETQEEFGITPRNLIKLGMFNGDENSAPSIQYLCTQWDGDIHCDNVEMTAPAFANIEGLEDQDVKLFPAFLRAYNLLLNRINGIIDNPDVNEDGSAGSGNWGHAGRPGLVGGSMGAGYNASAPEKSGYAKEKGTGVGSMGGHSGAREYRVEKPGAEGTYSKKFGENRKYTGLVYAYRANEAYEVAKKGGAKPTERRKEAARELNVPTEEMGKDIRRVKAGKKAAETRKKALAEKADKAKAEEEAKQAKAEESVEKVAESAKSAQEQKNSSANENANHDGLVKASSGLYVKPEVQEAREKCDKIASDEMPPHTLSSKFNSKVKSAENRCHKELKNAVDAGYISEEQAQKLQAQEKDVLKTMKTAFEKQDFCIDANADVVEKILNDGFIKCQQETGTGDGVVNNRLRRNASKTMFGTNADDDATQFEKYGHLGNVGTGYGNYTDGTYDPEGQVQVVLNKERVADRTTFTMSDSLGNYYQPSKVTDPKISSFNRGTLGYSYSSISGTLDTYKSRANAAVSEGVGYHGNYLELQYHGRLTLSDISHINIPYSLFMTPRGKGLAGACAANGVKVEITGKPSKSDGNQMKFSKKLFDYDPDAPFS